VSETTRYAVLGLVARRPIHGYGVQEQVRRWPLHEALIPSGSSIYKALKQLSGAKLIEPTSPAVGVEGPAKTVYSATEDGKRSFEAWLRQPPRTYEDLCIRIGASRPADIPTLIELVRATEHDCLFRLQGIGHVPEAPTLAARDAPWAVIVGVLLARVETAELAARSGNLRDLKSTLESLLQNNVGESRER
jgi:DNA-binding PadR family transcriptional regulator